MIDKHLGKEGTPGRDAFEQELRIELLGHAIKEARIYHNLTQEQLGKLVGVQKAQISNWKITLPTPASIQSSKFSMPCMQKSTSM